MTCKIPEQHGNVHCANCLTGSFILKDGEVCPNGMRLENLPLESKPARAGRCLTCEEKRRLEAGKLSQT